LLVPSKLVEGYLERGNTDHLASGTEKSHSRAIAARWSRRVNCGVKTNRFMTILTIIFVAEKTRKRAQRVNAFKAEVVPITDLLMQSAFSQG
jgi:hypothetical protein